MVKINRKDKGKTNPAQCGKYGSRKLEACLLLPGRNKGIKTHKNQRQYGKGKKGAEADQVSGNGAQKRDFPLNQVLEGSTKNQQNQAHDAGNHKDKRIDGADQSGDKITPFFLTAVNPVQPFAHT